ncbi:MAG: hypothetical protein KQJ78_25500 [Deltaproteobacteria bacterium]|nr:hypothetical protein [Deltaproteobacteria bacterium]
MSSGKYNTLVFTAALVLSSLISTASFAQSSNSLLREIAEFVLGQPDSSKNSEALPGSHTDRRLKQGAYWIPSGNPWHGITAGDIAGHWRRVKEARGKMVYFVPNVAYNRWREQKLAQRVKLRRLGFKIPVPQPGELVMTIEEVQQSKRYWASRSGVLSDLMPHPTLVESEKNYPWRDLLRGAGWQGAMPPRGK